jgi:hypothetical protein
MSFGPKNNPELYSKVAAAKNRHLYLQHQIKELHKQQEQALNALQEICPHPVIIEFWNWTQENPKYPRRTNNICSAQRLCCVCHKREIVMFLLKTNEFLSDNSNPPPLPADEQFKILTSLPNIIFVPNNHGEFNKKINELQNLPLHELLKITKKDQ